MITHLDLTTEEQQHQQQPLINRTREQLQHHHHHLKATVAPHHKPSQTAASRRQGGGAMSGRGDQTRRAYLVNEDGTLTEMIDSSPTAQQGGAPDVPQWSSSESMHQVPTNGVFHLSTSGLPPSRHRQQPTYFGAAHLPSVPVAPHQLPLESAGRQRPLLDSIRTVPTAEQYAAMPYFADSDSSEDSPLSTIPQFGSDSSSLGSPDRRQSSDRSRSSARARSGPLDQYLIDKRRPAPGREASSDAACATAHVKVSAANIALSRASRSPSQRLPVECASSDDSLPSGRPFSPVHQIPTMSGASSSSSSRFPGQGLFALKSDDPSSTSPLPLPRDSRSMSAGIILKTRPSSAFEKYMETVPTNVPISELESTPISKKPARSHKKKSHSAKVEGQASKGHGSQTPVALVNPFSKRPIIGGKEDQDLTEDVYLIKGETVPVLNPAPPPLPSQQAHRRGSGSHSALSTTMSLRNVKDTRGTSPVRPSTRSGSAKGAPEEDDDSKGINNDDHCSACLGRGRLLCCDMCPKAFHFHCVEEAFESIDDVPQDSWECRSCRARKRAAAAKKGKRKSGSPANSLLPSGNRSFGVFDSLLNDLEGTNPRVFQLPREIVDSFENVYMHPATGAYIDTREMEVARPRVKSHRKGASAEAGAENKRSTSAGVGSGDPTAVSGASHLCFKCGESGYRLHTTSFLASFSFPQSDAAVYRPQAVRTELVKCDYCPLFWHLDCLNPPLTCIPPEMKEDEKEVVDVTHWNTLRNRTWGVEERGGRAEIVSNVPLPVGGPAKLDAGLIQIRKKWMCPCHVDWSLPKLRVNSGWKWVEVSENSPPYVSEGAEEAKITPPVANHAPPAVSLKVDDDEPVSPAAAAKARAASARADSKPVDDEPDSPAAGARPRAASGRAGSVAKRRAADEDLAQLASSGALKKSRTGSATPHRRKEVQHLDKYSAAAALAATSTPTTRRAAPSNTPTSTTAAVRGPSVAAPAGPSRAVIHIADSANNGDVEVINDPLTLEYYAAQSNQQKSRINSKKGASAAAKALLKEGIEDLEFGGVKYRLPERRIKLEFFEHVRSLPTIVRLPPAPTADVAPTGSSILNDPTKDQSFQSAFGHIGRSFRSRVDELYSSSDNANEQGRGLHSANAASLCYAAAVASDGVAEKCKGRLRATDEEAMEWLESVTMMQSELAYLINTRRAANAYVAQQDNHVSATAPHQADNNNNNNNSTSSGSDNTNNDTDKHPLAAPSSAPAKDAPLPPAPLTSTIATPAPGAPDDDTVVGISRAEYDAFLEWKRKNGNRSGSNTNPDDTTKS